MATPSPLVSPSFMLTPAGSGLVWKKWDDHHIVYQPSSTETHVFNDTTEWVLLCLGRGSATRDEVASWTAESLCVGMDELSGEDLETAMERLEELGLIERSDEASSGP